MVYEKIAPEEVVQGRLCSGWFSLCHSGFINPLVQTQRSIALTLLCL